MCDDAHPFFFMLVLFVIQSEAKNLDGVHVGVLVCAIEILPPFGRLNDKKNV